MATTQKARQVAEQQAKRRRGGNTAPAAPRKAVPAEVEAPRYFFSAFGNDIRVEHPDGSIAIVGEEPRKLPKKLWRLAIKQGCQTDTRIAPVELTGLTAGDDPFTRMGLMQEKILEALQADDTDPRYADAFDANDVPNLRWLEKACGFAIAAEERDQAWAEVQKDIPDGDDEDETDTGTGAGENSEQASD